MQEKKHLTAIVVDDSSDIVELFSEYLTLKGVRVLGTGRDGKEALELFKKHRPDIAFLDIMMPEYDGFYALEQIRKIDPHAKIMMVTADLTAETAGKLSGLESTALVYKPFDFNKILQAMKTLTESGLFDNMVFQGSSIRLREQ